MSNTLPQSYSHDATIGIFSGSELNKLVEESLVMVKFDHLNVMTLIGVSLHIRDSLYIVMPYMNHGSLLSFLRKNRADLTIINEDNNKELVRDILTSHIIFVYTYKFCIDF